MIVAEHTIDVGNVGVAYWDFQANPNVQSASGLGVAVIDLAGGPAWTGDVNSGRVLSTGGGTGEKRGPKTDPAAPHNAKIREEAAKLVAQGNKIVAGGGVKKEKLVPTPDGKKSGRRPDILYETPSGSVKGTNVGKREASGQPVKRERDAKEDLDNAGVPTNFVPYD